MTNLSYFATDGSFGDADEIMILDTTDWSELAWAVVEFNGDPSPELAFAVDVWVKTGETTDEIEEALDFFASN